MNMENLASELLGRLPTMTGEEQRSGREIYRQLARGEPVLRSEVAEALEVPTFAVDNLLGHPSLKCMTYLDNEGRIIGFGGLPFRPFESGNHSQRLTTRGPLRKVRGRRLQAAPQPDAPCCAVSHRETKALG